MSKLVMSVSVCTALLAASAAVSGALAANVKTPAITNATTAYAALVDGRNATAIKQYTLAINSLELPPEKLGRAYLNRALAFQNVKQYQGAIADYTAAMKLDVLSPKIRAVALYNRGLAHKNLKSPAMAIEDFTSALLLSPKFARAYYSRANVLRDHGQYLFALADYKKARRFNHPNIHLTYFGEALTYDALKQSTRAKALLIKSVELKPGFAPAREKLASMGQAGPLPTLAANQKRKPIQIAVAGKQYIPDTLITSSISPNKSDQTIRSSNALPKPVGVPAHLKATNSAPKMPALPKVAVAPTPLTNQATKSNVKKLASAPKTKVKTVVTSKNAPEMLAAAPKLAGWTVQLSSQRESTAAWDVWKNLSHRHAKILKGQKATVVKANLGSRGVFYRLRVHKLNSKKKAANLCSRLKRKGTSCFVSKA